MKKLCILFLVFFIMSLSACSNSNSNQDFKKRDEKMKAENKQLDAEQAEEKNVLKPITVKVLLDEFKSWNGNKSFGKNIYTLNLDNDTYILTIKANTNDNNVIDWVEMIYLKPLQKSYSINTEELKYLQELASLFSIDSDEWMQNVIDANLPYEKSLKDWKTIINYYIYQGKKEGISLNFYNLQKPTSTPIVTASNLNKERQEFADKIRGALSPVCDRAYFNSKGEFILEVNSEWYTVKEETKKDIIYSIEKQLKDAKKNLEVEGYGQFFSDSGRPLESFYAK